MGVREPFNGRGATTRVVSAEQECPVNEVALTASKSRTLFGYPKKDR